MAKQWYAIQIIIYNRLGTIPLILSLSTILVRGTLTDTLHFIKNGISLQELILAEKWARHNKLPFPRIAQKVKDYTKEDFKECFVFHDEDKPNAPIVMHFILGNKTFKTHKLSSSNSSEFIIFHYNIHIKWTVKRQENQSTQ